MKSHRIGAVMFALWGVMHMVFGAQMFALNATGSANAIIDAFYLDAGPDPTPGSLGSTVDAIMYQHAWNLFWFGAASTLVAVFLNWRNSLAGYWANMVLISAADVGFVVAVMIPGNVSVGVGIWGPVFWIIGAIFATLGILEARRSQAPA